MFRILICTLVFILSSYFVQNIKADDNFSSWNQKSNPISKDTSNINFEWKNVYAYENKAGLKLFDDKDIEAHAVVNYNPENKLDFTNTNFIHNTPPIFGGLSIYKKINDSKVGAEITQDITGNIEGQLGTLYFEQDYDDATLHASIGHKNSSYSSYYDKSNLDDSYYTTQLKYLYKPTKTLEFSIGAKTNIYDINGSSNYNLFDETKLFTGFKINF